MTFCANTILLDEKMTKQYIASSFLDTLLEYLTSNQYHAPDLVKQISVLKKRYQWRMPKPEFIELLQIIDQRYPNPALGFRIGRSLKPQHYGMVGYMAVTCANLGQALQRYQQHFTLVDSALNIEAQVEGLSIVARWWKNDPVAKGIFSEFGLMVFVNFCQALIGRDLPPEFVELPGEANGDPGIYEMLIGCPVKFNADAVGISFPTSYYAKKISTADPYLRNLYDRQAAILSTELAGTDDFLVKVKQSIKVCLEQQQISAELVAKYMNLSLRTFYRHLQEHGVSYRSLLANTRYSLAKNYLQDSNIALAEIALTLGYSEQSAFSRAFTSWAGSTPSQFRIQTK